jgi:hypothetical protein
LFCNDLRLYLWLILQLHKVEAKRGFGTAARILVNDLVAARVLLATLPFAVAGLQ